MRKRWLRLVAVPVALSLVAAACGDDDDDAGGGTEATAGTDAPEGTAAPEGTDAPDGTDAPEGTEAPDDTTDGTEAPEGTGGGDEQMFDGEEITITGPERAEEEAGSLQAVLGAWGEEHGLEITYTGDADWEANINTQVQGGNPPDISIFPQPGKLADFARDGDVVALNDTVAAAVAENWPESWAAFGNVDGTQYGVPVKADLKSLVW